MTVRIAPSILAADFARLADEIARVEAGGADFVHVDVMDGHFVPNITIGVPVVAALRKVTALPLDVHLMISQPDRYLDAFAAAGASTLTVHLEAATHLHRTLSRIRELGMKAGLAINPATPVDHIRDVVAELDLLLVMSVNPGFGGQTFIRRSFTRIEAARALLKQAGSQADIEVDGGVDLTNAGALARAGATILVAGVSVFGSPIPPRPRGPCVKLPVPANKPVAPASTTTLRVRYAETDRMGVVYYANYLVWFEVARADLLRTLGWTYREMEESGVYLPVIEAHCEYRRPARYDDDVEIRTTGSVVSAVRMSFEYEVRIKGQSEIAAIGRTEHAATGADGRPCRLPARVREVFA